MFMTPPYETEIMMYLSWNSSWLDPAWVEAKILLCSGQAPSVSSPSLSCLYRPVHSCRGYHIPHWIVLYTTGSVSLTLQLVNIERRFLPDLKTTLIFNDQLYNPITVMYSLFPSLLSLYVTKILFANSFSLVEDVWQYHVYRNLALVAGRGIWSLC